MDLSTANWRKSSFSAGGSDNCVEVAVLPGTVAIRDSRDPHGPVRLLRPAAFRDLITRIKRGDFNH
jgi:uncharacterized protein DUF397